MELVFVNIIAFVYNEFLQYLGNLFNVITYLHVFE